MIVVRYNKLMSKRTRLTTDQKLRALTLLARGDTLSQTSGHLLDEYGVTVSESALSQLRKQHTDTISKMQDTMAEAEAADAEQILKKSRKMIGARLARAERDSSELEQLDREYRENEIDYSEYKRKKATLMKISINELNNIAKATHTQIMRERGGDPPDPSKTLPPGSTPALGSTPAHLEALLNAIKAGNTVEIQRLVFNPAVAPKALENDQPITV